MFSLYNNSSETFSLRKNLEPYPYCCYLHVHLSSFKEGFGMKNFFLGVLFAGLSSVSIGALPPFFQSQAEIVSLMAAPAVQEKLDSASSIESISKEGSIYTLKTTSTFVRVRVNYLPRPEGTMGPQRFEFEIEEEG